MGVRYVMWFDEAEKTAVILCASQSSLDNDGCYTLLPEVTYDVENSRETPFSSRA